MKTPPRLSFFPLLALAILSCKGTGRGMDRDQMPPQRFASPGEAANKAKEDLLAVLSADSGLNIGVDRAAIVQSQLGAPLRRVDVDFSKLLVAIPTSGLDSLVAGERTTVVPLTVGTRVLTIVEVSRDEQGWKVVGLGGTDIANEVGMVRDAVGDSAGHDITLYEIPNLQTRLYGVTRAGTTVLFANYGQRFRIEKGVSPPALIAVLKADAIEFQAKYGEALKNQRLAR